MFKLYVLLSFAYSKGQPQQTLLSEVIDSSDSYCCRHHYSTNSNFFYAILKLKFYGVIVWAWIKVNIAHSVALTRFQQFLCGYSMVSATNRNNISRHTSTLHFFTFRWTNSYYGFDIQFFPQLFGSENLLHIRIHTKNLLSSTFKSNHMCVVPILTTKAASPVVPSNWYLSLTCLFSLGFFCSLVTLFLNS